MPENCLVKLFEHNNWANLQIIQGCVGLSDEQLDAPPRSPTRGSIRSTLLHLVSAQRDYLTLLTVPVDARFEQPLDFGEVASVARASGEGLLDLVRDESGRHLDERLLTLDGYIVEPWVVLLQAINHATEHREQIKSMLSALGATPPEIDGWNFGLETHGLFPQFV